MMDRGRTAILALVSLLMLSVPALAEAECAWVLWTTRYKMSGTTAMNEVTVPSDAYSTRAECNSALERLDVREDDRRKKDPTSQSYFICLPDTVDPRGQKGK